MKSGDETLEGLVKNKIQMKRWSEPSKRGIREQKVIVVGKSAFLTLMWEEAEKGEKKMHRCFSLHSLTPIATKIS